ncbi:calcium-binding protein [Streptomyces sp. S.PNR 29]|uniref:calcium-binding protein n=1 Tax=Streptomyces sp. S.PNR 29 TaxID=2973805 RepID=UPI0025B0BFAF|nr:calcium-binding protein [Streptomyces sp. S.PNR 29]MDN0197971.1 calcium-binding protein [Streptomyces sp. S.PNR 29]
MSRFAAPPSDRHNDGRHTAPPIATATAAPRRKPVGAATSRAAVAGTVAVVLAGLGTPADAASGTTPSDPVITSATVNSGHDVIVGITHNVTFPVTITGSDDSGLAFADVDLKGPHGGFYTTDAFCQTPTACTTMFTVNAHPAPGSDDPVDLANANAGTWSVDALADAHDGDSVFAPRVGSFGLKRAARLTVNASPEPVTKGAPITVTGKLVRANWDTYRYAGYTGQTVQLQFRPKSSSTYTTVATVTTSSTGTLRTTVKAANAGYWRWKFTGTTTTGPAKATGDYVEVRP